MTPYRWYIPAPMVYLDNAASTPLAPAALHAFAATAQEHFANPSSSHALGAAAARALAGARADVARLLRADAQSIIFTSGGTEANALAVLGVTRLRKQTRIVVSAIEHASVLRTVERLQGEGFAPVFVGPGANGVVDAQELLAHVDANTSLVVLMLANNELGTLQPVDAVARMCKQLPRPPHVHVDAIAAAPFVRLDVAALGVDSLALSAHKLHGPKGVGACWLRKGVRLAPLWHGGGQEGGLRQGTENLAGAVSFGKACAAIAADLHEASTRVAALRDSFEQAALSAIPHLATTIPAGTARAAHISSLRLARLPAEPLLHALQARGVCAAAGSACASKSNGQSHVLAAIGVDRSDAVLRFSLSRLTTQADIDCAVDALALAVAEIRQVVHAPSAWSVR